MVLNEPVYGIAYWAQLWSRWLRTRGEKGLGEELPQYIKDLYDIWTRMHRTVDDALRARVRWQRGQVLPVGKRFTIE